MFRDMLTKLFSKLSTTVDHIAINFSECYSFFIRFGTSTHTIDSLILTYFTLFFVLKSIISTNITTFQLIKDKEQNVGIQTR